MASLAPKVSLAGGIRAFWRERAVARHVRLVLAAKREVVVVAFRVKEDGALGLAAQHARGAWIGSEQRTVASEHFFLVANGAVRFWLVVPPAFVLFVFFLVFVACFWLFVACCYSF